MALRFSCGLNGQCQEDPHGRYRTLANCQRECHAVEAKELHYLIYGYTPEAALDLAPRDRIELVRRETGVIVDATDAYNILLGLGTDDLTLLARYPILYPYLYSHYDHRDFSLALLESGTVEAIPLLLEDLSVYALFKYANDVANFITASNYDREVMEVLHQRIPAVLESALKRTAHKSVPALTFLLELYPLASLNDLHRDVAVAVLEELVTRGYTELVAGWADRCIYDRTSLATSRWYIRRYPYLRSAVNVATAVLYDGWNFVAVVSQSQSLGRAAVKAFVQLCQEEYEIDVVVEITELVENITNLEELSLVFALPHSEFPLHAEILWHSYLTVVLDGERVEDWKSAIAWLYQNHPVWYNRENEYLFTRQHLVSLQELADEILLSHSEVSQYAKQYLQDMDFTPSIGVLLLKAPQYLSRFKMTSTTEAQVRSMLASVVDVVALQWILRYFPVLGEKLSFAQRVLLQLDRTHDVALGNESDNNESDAGNDSDSDNDTIERMTGDIPLYTCNSGNCELSSGGEYEGYSSCVAACR